MSERPKTRTIGNRDHTGHDVITTGWPITTLASYQMTLKELATLPEEQMNMKMQRLCETRAKFTHLILALKNCRALWKDTPKVVERLKEIEERIWAVVVDYPLEIRNRRLPSVPKTLRAITEREIK